jgi:NTE family protein
MRDEVGHLAIMASTSIPGVFPPIEIGGDPYVDGGILLNTPLKPAIEAGGETLHVIYLDPDVKNIPLRRLQNTLDTLDRMMTTSFAAKVNMDMKLAARINHHPSVPPARRYGRDFGIIAVRSAHHAGSH